MSTLIGPVYKEVTVARELTLQAKFTSRDRPRQLIIH